ncbi:MAG: ferrochelatase [Myxococcaceae bacterium]
MTAAPALSQPVTCPSGRRGVLLVNVGTPDAPTAPAVRHYLREFLGDPRVIDLPAPGRWLLLNAIILPFRPPRSARAYEQIWTPTGSPLLLHSKAQREALAERLPGVPVALGMRYGNPSLPAALEELRTQGVSHVTLVPLYPQYAGATTGTAEDAFRTLMGDAAHSITSAFFQEPGFVKAVASKVRAVVDATQAQAVVFSYHGLPVRQVKQACTAACDGHQGGASACGPLGESNARCYRAQCFATSRAIAREAGLAARVTSFQSRLKGTGWLGPHTDETVARLARQGVKRAAIVCPSFVADCLETLEEIGQRAAHTFQAAGGDALTLVPAVNDDPTFIEALATLIRRHWGARRCMR